jgi:mRNA interferase RelE/StbE
MLFLDMSKQAAKFLKALPAKRFKQLGVKILELLQNPTPNDYSKLKGYDALYRVDVGEYRVVYEFDKARLSVLLVDQRNDDAVYKALKNK